MAKDPLKEFCLKIDGPIRVYCDNKTTISMAHNSVHHDWASTLKFISIFIEEKEGTTGRYLHQRCCKPYIQVYCMQAKVRKYLKTTLR